MPFRIAPTIVSVLWIAVIGAGVGGFIWIAEKLWVGGGAAVKAQFAEAARKKNVDISAYNDAEEAIDAIVAAKVQEALARSKAVPSDLKYTAGQAEAINAIRRAGQ